MSSSPHSSGDNNNNHHSSQVVWRTLANAGTPQRLHAALELGIALLDGGCLAAAGPPDEVLTADLVGLHYRTAVRVISGDQGPIVVPTRTPRD